jgi:hypothetical protein
MKLIHSNEYKHRRNHNESIGAAQGQTVLVFKIVSDWLQRTSQLLPAQGIIEPKSNPSKQESPRKARKFGKVGKKARRQK